MQQGLEARVGAQRVEGRAHQDPWAKAFFISPFKPRHGLIFLTETEIDQGRFRPTRTGTLEPIREIRADVFRLVLHTRQCVGVCKIRDEGSAARRQVHGFPKLRNGVVEHALFREHLA